MNRTIALSLAVVGLLVAGCKEDLRPVVESWNTATTQWQTKIDALKAEDAEQAKKLAGVCSTEGLDPGNVAAKSCAESKVATQSDQADLEALESALARHRALVDAAVGRGKRVEAEVSVEAAKAELTARIAKVTSNGQLRLETSKQIQAAVTQEFEAAKAAAIAADAKARLWGQAAAQKIPLELTAIRFTQGTAELEPAEAGPQTQLQELIVWANSCPGLTFSITAHQSKELPAAEAVSLTAARALAVKKFLVDNGVAASKISGATGSGAKQPVVDEPAPGSEAARTMNPEDLEALRNKNRRITIQAVNVCPTGERAELVRP